MELIAILVGRGIKGKDFMSVSRGVVNVVRKEVEEGRDLTMLSISKVSGVGDITAMRILCGIELGRRLYEKNDTERCFVKSSDDAYRVLRNLGEKKQEYIVGLFLNSRFELVKKKTICIGSLDGVSVLPRDVIIPALEYNANSVILAHNHPSGDCTPSNEDVVVTRRLQDGLELVGLNLLDHIVIGKNQWSRVEI